jgi:diguanylate cyclase (GGDEF)-like protein
MSDLVGLHADVLGRWFDGSETLAVLLYDQAGGVLEVNRSFVRRSGRSGTTSELRLADLFEDPDGSPPSPILARGPGTAIAQQLVCRGDGTQWRCVVHDVGEGRRLLVAMLEGGDDAARATGGLVQEFAAMQLELVRRNRELTAAKEEIASLLRTDALTGVATRMALEERLALETARCARTWAPLSMVACDIDHFKRVNDTFGHGVGDVVLARVGALLRGCCRPVDLPARMGGEEFLVLAPGVDALGASALAERIRVAVSDIIFPELEGRVTASFGVAQLLPGEDVAAWLKRADGALYEAKHKGRNRVQIASG